MKPPQSLQEKRLATNTKAKEKAVAEEQDTFNDIVAAIDANESEPERHLSIQIDKSIRDAVRAAKSSGQPSSVTVTVKVRPETERRITFSANVSAKLPRPPVSGVTLFADEHGAVHKADPAQVRFDFKKATENDHDEDEEKGH